jgi:hypothetical protein
MLLLLIYFIQVLDSFLQFFFYVCLSLLASGKLNEKERHTWVQKEFFFSLLTVFIHSISHNLEVNGASTDHFLDILLLEVMTQND